jgi:hypothetical protein
VRLNNTKNAKAIKIKYIERVCNNTAVDSKLGSENEA